MIQAKISLLGLWRADSTLLDDLHLPDVIDANALKKRLLIDSAGLEVLYSDPDMMKEHLENYSALRLHAWEEMAKVLIVDDYDPFTNVNRHEERTNVETRDLTGTFNGDATGKVAGFNSEDFSNQNQMLNDNKSTDTGTITRTETFDLKGDSAISDTQDLIKKEIEIRRAYDLYKIIISDILFNSCLMIY